MKMLVINHYYYSDNIVIITQMRLLRGDLKPKGETMKAKHDIAKVKLSNIIFSFFTFICRKNEY